MRVAILADIHGNSAALDAVLADIERRGGVDAYWVLGDLCAIGGDPVRVLERLSLLPDALFIRGNADRFSTTTDLPGPTFEQVRQNPDLIPILSEVAASFAWTRGYLIGAGWDNWLRDLPMERRMKLPDGTRILLTHAAPGTDDGMGLNPTLTDDELREKLAGSTADLVLVGHFHYPMSRTLDGIHVVNPGSVSNPFAPDLRAAYAILNADENGHAFTFHRADYDRHAVIEAMNRIGYPGVNYVTRFLRGEVRASWMERWDGVSYTVSNTE